jgi:peptidoglycan hydrolase CwlO-like protein
LQNILFSSDDTANGGQTNKNVSSSRLINDDNSSDESTYRLSLSQIEGEELLPHIVAFRGQRNTIGVPNRKSKVPASNPANDNSNDGELSNADSSRKCISETNQTKPQELLRPVRSSHDQPAMNSMAPSSISIQSYNATTDQQSVQHTDIPQMQVEDNPSVDYSGYEGHASTVDSSIFVGKSTVASPSMILPIDSMDSEEPLVSARGQATYFHDSSQPIMTQPLLPMESIDLPSSSPTYAMFESFVKEIDSLVTKLTPDKLEVSTSAPITDEPLPLLDNTRLESHFESANGDIEHPRRSLLEAEISSLTEKIQSLSNEIRESEIHHFKIRAILNEDDDALISSDVALSWPQTCDTLESAIRKRKSLIVELESRLQSTQSERDNLSKELRQSQERISDSSNSVQCIEKDLSVAREAIDSQAHASTPLQSEIQRLKKQLEDLMSNKNSSSNFFVRLDDLLGNNIDEATMFDERQHKSRIDCIRNIISQSHEVIIKLKESQMNINVLESKNQELDEQLRMYKESQNQMESKMLESEKLAEEAIAASETIAGEADEVQRELVMVQKAHQELLTAHSVALEDRNKLSSEFERNAAQMVERESEILGLKDSIKLCHDERDQLKEQLSLVGAKTVEVMKHHIEGLKADYARRFDSFKANYVSEINNVGLAQLRLDLSKKEAENVSLRTLIEEMSSKLSNVEEQLSQNQRELTSVSKQSLKENEEKNAMKDELNHLRSLMDIAEESIGELNRLKEENQQLMDMIRSQNNDQQSHISSLGASYEIKGMSDNDHLMYERISALMRENEHNNITMRTLQVSVD